MIATRIERLIPDATGCLAILIMACAFLHSFANLQAGAVPAGISQVRESLHQRPPDCREPDDPPVLASAGVHPVRVVGGCYIHRGEHRVSSPTVKRISSAGQLTPFLRLP